MDRFFDTIIIGSGIGGLTCGAFLARAGMRVCILEKHTRIGGYAHDFSRNGYRFDSGIHSVPMGRDGFIFHLLRLLGVEKEVEAIPHDFMYSFSAADERYAVPALEGDILAKLTSDFPFQKKNIHAFYNDMHSFYRALIEPLFHFEERFTAKDTTFISRYFNRSYKDYINQFITDEKLSRIFCSQWPFWGMPSELSPTIFCTLAFYVHAIEGSHYIKGGFSRLADALAKAVTSRGGLITNGVEVKGLVTEGDSVRSVLTGSGEEMEARWVVSDISPYLLHRQMVPENSRNKMWLRRLKNLTPSVSATGVYCGVTGEQLFSGRSTLDFWFDGTDYKDIYRSMTGTMPEEPNHLIFLRSPDENKKKTVQILEFCHAAQSADLKRDKEKRVEKILAAAEKYIPGFRTTIEVLEAGSPATFEYFSGNTGGALYGFENTREVYGEARLPNTTYLKNLFQTGHWCKPGGGVWNVMECGYTSAHTILQQVT